MITCNLKWNGEGIDSAIPGIWIEGEERWCDWNWELGEPVVADMSESVEPVGLYALQWIPGRSSILSVCSTIVFR